MDLFAMSLSVLVQNLRYSHCFGHEQDKTEIVEQFVPSTGQCSSIHPLPNLTKLVRWSVLLEQGEEGVTLK